MNNQSVPTSAREIAEQKYSTARGNLLLMTVLTVINAVLLLANSSYMLLFSATVPYLSIAFALAFDGGLFYAFLSVAVIDIAIYLAAWQLSKKNYGWMILSLVLFILDTIIMIGMYLLIEDASGILDILIHAIVLYYLIVGVKYGKKLKNMPESEPVPATDESASDFDSFDDGTVTDGGFDADTPIIRVADMTVKNRILLETDANGQHIVYRRVKKTNELIINGFVYAELEMLVEPAHELTAHINGHDYVAGYDGGARSYISVDSEIVAKKIRLF